MCFKPYNWTDVSAEKFFWPLFLCPEKIFTSWKKIFHSIFPNFHGFLKLFFLGRGEFAGGAVQTPRFGSFWLLNIQCRLVSFQDEFANFNFNYFSYCYQFWCYCQSLEKTANPSSWCPLPSNSWRFLFLRYCTQSITILLFTSRHMLTLLVSR